MIGQSSHARLVALISFYRPIFDLASLASFLLDHATWLPDNAADKVRDAAVAAWLWRKAKAISGSGSASAYAGVVSGCEFEPVRVAKERTKNFQSVFDVVWRPKNADKKVLLCRSALC